MQDDEDRFPVASGAPSKDFASNFDYVMVFKSDGVTPLEAPKPQQAPLQAPGAQQ